MRSILLAGVLAAACAGDGSRRFPDRVPLWREPEKPFSPAPRAGDDPGSLDAELRLLDDQLALVPKSRALDVNSVDEVPDSSFFENRIARISADEVARGGERGPPLETSGPVTVVKAKPGGITLGFVVEDARGSRFVLKLDPIGRYGLLSGAEAVASRLLWAAGYNVPDNRVVDLPVESLVPGEGVDPGMVARTLARAARGPDGRLRALASRLVPGRILGPMAFAGRRPDDPNDRIPHEHRRELRALSVFYAWMNNPDANPANSLDAWHRGRVTHYLLDLGTSFGAGGDRDVLVGWWAPLCPAAAGPTTPVDGHARVPARCEALRERAREVAGDPLLGAFTPTVDPFRFETEPNPAFARRDDGDLAWAARILSAFTREQLEAAAAASAWPPDVQRRLVDRLESRRRSILRALFGRVSPFGRPAVVGRQVCAEDLGARVLSRRGRSYRGRPCQRPSGIGYRVLSFAARAAPGGPLSAPMRVHVVTDGRELRIVGVER